jgi:transposase
VRHDTEQVSLSFCDGQPDSQHTLRFIPALLDIARREGKRVVVILWDNASWHKSKQVRRWVRAYNQQAKRDGDVRLLVFRLPTKSPWLNPMEPRWVHAKRQVCEPVSDLNAGELQRRLGCHFETDPFVC